MSLPDAYRGGDVVLRPGTGSPASFVPDAQIDRLNFRTIIAIFRRRLIMFTCIVLICVLLAYLFTLRTISQYTANADVVIKSGSSEVTPTSGGTQPETPQRAEQIETELQMIKSRDLAAKVFDQLRLAEDGGFAREIGGDRATMREKAVGWVIQKLDAARIGSAYAIRISYTDDDPKRAARIANGFANVYTQSQITTKETDNNRAIEILQSRMEQLRSQAQMDFGAVQRYRIQNGLPSSSATALTEQEISSYNQQIAIARAEAAEDQAKLNTARAQMTGGSGSVGEAQVSPVVQSLRSQRAQVSARVAEMSGRYLDTHPELQSARRQLADIDAQITVEVNRTLSSLDAKARATAQRLASLEGSLGSARGKLAANNNAMIALDDLERRAQASQALYESYLNRYKEAVAQSGAEQSDARILSVAQIPRRPSSPNLPLNLTLGLLVGLLLGTAAAVVAESAYAGLTTGEDVEQRLGVRYLGSVPLLASIEHHAETAPETIAQHPGGAFVEALRSVLASVRQAPNGRNQVIAITSALPGEGKTTLAASLARAAAMSGERVVLIDCDIIRCGMARIFPGGAGGPGLRELLQGTAKMEDVRVVDPASGATILQATTAFEKGERLLEKGSLHRLIAKLREEYDLILLDCAPILPIAETREIVALADNVVMMARWRQTTDYAVRSALKLLPMRAIDDIGVVLNAIDMRKRARFGYGDSAFFYNQYKNYYDVK